MNKNELIEQWFLRYGDEIYKFLVYYMGTADVEDLLQDVFIKALQALDHFEGRSLPKTWLLSIARNSAVDYQRKQRLRKWLPDSFLSDVRDHRRTPEEWLNLHEEKRELYQTLQHLKPAHREVLILRGIKELSPKETAEILQWSENKVHVTYHRAIKALKDRWGQQGQEGIGDAVKLR
ncbi:RNA polymerase sigma factor [Brevibacillus ruminantium]|uniref:RNA polymerase sigma factor n=1 Tax=Brevibacillus ruminantium TaxID=2950604 RepID=A0ABY4WIP9_9BACL|nr:RNA polymerase sigma factor [Brevibacillus ruminantium]USG65224.1 RNA polymerase sigma factor [Brevibacillus ruminantium]